RLAPRRSVREHRCLDRGGDPRRAVRPRGNDPHHRRPSRLRCEGRGRDPRPRRRVDRRARPARASHRGGRAVRPPLRAPAGGKRDRDRLRAVPPPSSATREREDDEVLGKAYDARLMRRLLGFVRPHAHLVALSGVLLLLVSVAQLSQPYIVKLAIDGPVARRDVRGINLLVLLYVIALVTELAF